METFDKTETAPGSERRPWGAFRILDEGAGYKVKRLEVLPGKRLSLQRHARRDEHWLVVRGTAKVTLNDAEILLSPGESIDIPALTKHRIENSDPAEMFVIIEVWLGDHLEEDDIERFEDDFGRA